MKMEDTQSTGNIRKEIGKYSPVRMLVMTIGGIVIAETLAMLVIIPLRHWPYVLQVLMDATVTAIIIFPLLFFFTLKPLLQNIQYKNKTEQISKARLRLIRFVYSHSLDELLQASLDEIEALTGSSIGFFHFLEADQRTLSLQAWSTNTLEKMCKAEGKGSHYDVDQAGVWADCIRLRKVIIHNNYASLPNKKGLPEGHAQVIREITVPIVRDEKILAILGVGNKPVPYTARDVEDVSTIADFVWDIVEKKKAENALRESEDKFHTLMDWTYDWEKWLDPVGNIIYTSPSCKRITGYSPEEFIENPELLKQIVHPDDLRSYLEHHRILHDQQVGPATIEYRVIDREGNVHWIEHVCRPLFGENNRYLGRRISNRDITERKSIEEEIRKKNQKEVVLTKVIQNIQTDIAHDLHDTLGQNISYLRMNLESLADSMTKEKSDQLTRIQNLTRAANESYELVRSMLTVLKSGDSADPIQLFAKYAVQVAERSSFQVDTSIVGEPRYLPPQVVRQIFFIFREVLNNIEKHSAANLVRINFSWNNAGLQLNISDNGKGFEHDQRQSGDHYGINIMQERAEQLKGSFSISSKLGEGTTIKIFVPLEN